MAGLARDRVLAPSQCVVVDSRDQKADDGTDGKRRIVEVTRL